ncbi:MAG: hypothetical protein JWR00_3943 [Rubritepida sp.]|nr:hypothetical protein [Rubritepida sp.]
MIRILTMTSVLALAAACAAPPSEAVRDRPVATGASRDGAEPARPARAPANFNPLDTGVSAIPGGGGGGY